MRKIVTLLICLVFISGTLLAQRTVSGKVTGDKGESLPGISVMVKGTNVGTATNAEGRYTLTVPEGGRSLVFSSVDYGTVEKDIKGNTLDVELTTAAKGMDEVVVVAYGTQKKESITGSVAKIGAEQLATRLTTNITQALAGAAPGISTTSGNGQPGSSAAIRIRGIGSVNASSAPLFVVDGFPYDGFIGDLSTSDIESITLLKDASSTALYGSRAANGVVIVTTKKGVSAAPKINLTYTVGKSSRAIAEYDRIDVREYFPLFWKAIKNSRMYNNGDTEAAAIAYANANIGGALMYNPFNVPAEQLVTNDGKLNPSAQLLYNDFDWLDGVQHNGLRNEVGLNISSKVQKTDYFLSFNYLKDNGFIIKSDYERANARLSLNTQAKPWLKAGINVSGIYVKSNQANAESDNAGSIVNPFVFARGIGPIYPVHAFDASGAPVLDAFGNQWNDYGMHPGAINRPTGAYPGRHVILETELNTSESYRNSMIGRAYLEATIAKNFKFNINGGVDLNNTRTRTAQNNVVGDGVTSGGTSYRTANEYRTLSANQILSYNKAFGVHEVTAMVGHENQWIDENYFSGNRRGMNLDGNIELVNYVTLNGVSGYVNNLRRDAYLSRVNYSYDNKYFLDLSFRRDGSSRFSPNARWGNFYSIGGAWQLSKESFLQDKAWIDNLKLRAAFGTVGNDFLDTYYEFQPQYGLGWNNSVEPGALASSIGNSDLTWEVNKNFTVGTDFVLFKNRISGSLEWFTRGSSELLFDVPQGLSSIVTSRTENVGTMKNTGWEFQLNGSPVRNKNFTWDMQFNFTTYKNKMTKLPNGQAIPNGTKRLEEGKDIYAFYLRQWYGVDPTDGTGLWYKDPEITTTSIRVINGDTLTFNPNAALYEFSGSAIPKLFGSLNNTFNYKGVFLSVLLNYQIGGKFYDGVYAGLLSLSYGTAVHKDMLNAWETPGQVTGMPRADVTNYGTYNNQSTRFLVDASYLSVRSITLGYDLPKNWISKATLSNARVYVSGENVAIFSKRKGLNPTENFNGTNSNVYVPNRYISAGINVTF